MAVVQARARPSRLSVELLTQGANLPPLKIFQTLTAGVLFFYHNGHAVLWTREQVPVCAGHSVEKQIRDQERDNERVTLASSSRACPHKG